MQIILEVPDHLGEKLQQLGLIDDLNRAVTESGIWCDRNSRSAMEDIVLAFHEPGRRQYTDFAAAS